MTTKEKEYVKPSTIRINRNADSERLYDLEHDCHGAIEACAREWLKQTGNDQADFWVRGLPQALFDLLESYDRHAARLAAQAYLEEQGFTVSKP